MARYFTLVRGTMYTDKNQLHKSLKSLANQFSNLILDTDEDLEELGFNLQEGVDEVHGEHPRCKEIPLCQTGLNHVDDGEPGFYTSFYCSGVFYLMIYKEKEVANA